ncbi:hypothetical protein FOCC_FOCC001813 [Frankliniella occidentalis]|uniref:UDP-N-acetylglucosamine diphosphorylase n=1 Tax=Frankliniella occidentalis TaxID=133901 RepID=A0A6J1T657_FRAOC|nr:UDP-N-acetylhexosamine pyrophosphorylase [Frankliniella occidentalis]KAE8751566.1 hypothetical protein FOCC_FOCC001813 [Frankliniella occidentalis]
MEHQYENLRNSLTKHGQEHLLRFWPQLDDTRREELLRDIQSVDVEEVCAYFARTVRTLEEQQQKLDDRMQPIPPELSGSLQRSSPQELETYRAEGLGLIASGKVGVLLMAGGQGTRLGVDFPKGMYDIGLPSHKPLFQIQAERIRRVEQLAQEATGKKGCVTWYIMTSGQTMEPTLAFMRKHKYFGLNSANVKLFEQGMLPCFSMDGNIILDSPSRLSKAPDGNGGIYRALRDCGMLDDIEQRGICCLHAHSVDNILVQVADPIFIGYCSLKGAQCGVKVVPKAYPTEAVGVVCSVDGKYQVVEYNEITQATAERRNEDGELTFSAGSICNHYFSSQFLRGFLNDHEKSLPLHIAKKKIPYVDENGVQVKPDKPNGIKMEKFVFDVFPFTDSLVVWEVLRNEEFSPVKNADSAEKDCPRTARQDIINLHISYVEKAGGKILPGPDGSTVCEISPLLSYGGEGLEDLVKGKTFTSPHVLLAPGEELVVNGKANGVACGTVNRVNGVSNGISNGVH